MDRRDQDIGDWKVSWTAARRTNRRKKEKKGKKKKGKGSAVVSTGGCRGIQLSRVGARSWRSWLKSGGSRYLELRAQSSRKP